MLDFQCLQSMWVSMEFTIQRGALSLDTSLHSTNGKNNHHKYSKEYRSCSGGLTTLEDEVTSLSYTLPEKAYSSYHWAQQITAPM